MFEPFEFSTGVFVCGKSILTNSEGEIGVMLGALVIKTYAVAVMANKATTAIKILYFLFMSPQYSKFDRAIHEGKYEQK